MITSNQAQNCRRTDETMNERLQSDCRHDIMPHLSTNKTIIHPSTQSIYTHFEIGKHNCGIVGRRRFCHGADFAAWLRHMLRRRWCADSWTCLLKRGNTTFQVSRSFQTTPACKTWSWPSTRKGRWGGHNTCFTVCRVNWKLPVMFQSD